MKRDPNRQIYTVKEIAEYLSVHQSTIYRLIKRREIPCFKIGSDWRFRIDEISKWISAKSGG